MTPHGWLVCWEGGTAWVADAALIPAMIRGRTVAWVTYLGAL